MVDLPVPAVNLDRCRWRIVSNSADNGCCNIGILVFFNVNLGFL